MESARCPQPRNPSPTFSAASKEQQPSPVIVETLIPNAKETTGEMNPIFPQQKQPENVRTVRVADIFKATHESMSVKEPASQGSAQLADEEVQQKLAPGEAAKKKKKKKVRMPPNDMWKTPQDFAAENYMMHTAPSAYDPIDQDIKNCGRSVLESLLRVAICCIDRPETHFAEVIGTSIIGLGTDEDSLTRAIVMRAEIDLMKVRGEYFNIYKTSLQGTIRTS